MTNLSAAITEDTNSSIDTENLYGAHNYHPLPVVLVRGSGVFVWDLAGKKYLDMMSAYSAVSHGHCHPRLVKALQEQAQTLNIVSRAYYTDKLAAFIARACELAQYEKALPMNTGAEAVETALKAARKWAYQVKGVPAGKAEIISCEGNFHGRTIAIVGMSSIPQYKAGFGPFPAGFKQVPYGDSAALARAITPNTAAFLVEPIQGEGGIKVPPPGYLTACAQLCKQHNVLMICDEVQTGLGRTGKLFAFQHEDIKPDALILGKALGGGILPVSLFLTSKEVMDVFGPGDHGSTFGGNPLAAVVAKTALDVLVDENLTERAHQAGNYFREQLQALKSPLAGEVRGRGLLIGLEINPPYSAREVCLQLLQEGILTKETHETVIRFAPPLLITKAEIDQALSALQKVFSRY